MTVHAAILVALVAWSVTCPALLWFLFGRYWTARLAKAEERAHVGGYNEGRNAQHILWCRGIQRLQKFECVSTRAGAKSKRHRNGTLVLMTDLERMMDTTP